MGSVVKQRVLRTIILLVLGVYFILPLIAMAEFSTRGRGGSRSQIGRAHV